MDNSCVRNKKDFKLLLSMDGVLAIGLVETETARNQQGSYRLLAGHR